MLDFLTDHILCHVWRVYVFNKRDDLNFFFVNFPFMYSSFNAAPAYGVYIFSVDMLLHHMCFLSLRVAADKKNTEPGISHGKIKVITPKVFCRHNDLVDRYEISIAQMTMDIFSLS